MAESAELIKNLFEVGTIYHSLLFSYQRAKFHMGSRANIYVNPAIDHLLKMDEEGGLKLDKSKTFEEAVSVFTGFLVRSKMVKNCSLEKVLAKISMLSGLKAAFGQAKFIQWKLASKMLHALTRWLRLLCIRSIRVLFLMRMNQNTSRMELKQFWSLLYTKPTQ